MGDPVAHSESPELHRGFMRDAGIEGTYAALKVPASDGTRTFERLREEGYRGVNVTTPLKEEAYAFCATRDDVARAAGSVNTVVFGDGEPAGYNTDGIGALEALREALGGGVHGRRILILGAGPTARAAVLALREAHAHVALWNRTRERAERVRDALGGELWHAGLRLDAVLSTLLPNAEPADDALRNALIAAPIIVDANYGSRATLQRVLGRPVVGGYTMLHASARASFDLFVA